MQSQEWEGLHLDKDILIPGNKFYSPETTCFVPREINNVILVAGGKEYDYPYGVCFNKFHTKFSSNISERNKVTHIGYFNSEEEAHFCWQVNKARRIEEEVILYRELSCYRKDVEEALMLRRDGLLSDNANRTITENFQ